MCTAPGREGNAPVTPTGVEDTDPHRSQDACVMVVPATPVAVPASD